MLFLVAVLLAIIALKRSGGGSFRGLLESVAPPPSSAPSGAGGNARAFHPIKVAVPPPKPHAAE